MKSLPVRDGRLHFGAPLTEVARTLYVQLAARSGVTVPPLDRIAAVPPLNAQINANRWIVECPDCGGAEFVFPDTLLMLCASCWNAAIGGAWRPVALPPARRAAVERVLRARPLPQTRNWRPGESLGQLRRENRAQGVPERIEPAEEENT